MWDEIKKFLEEHGVPTAYIVVIASGLWARGKWNEYRATNEKIKKDQLDFITDVMGSEKAENSFIVEQAFHYRFGRELTYTEICYCLSLPNPTRAISYAVSSREFIEFKEDIARYDWKMGVNIRSRERWSAIGSTVLWLASCACVWIAAVARSRDCITLLLMVPILAFYAYLNLLTWWGIKDSKRLLEMRPRTQTPDRSA
jgi:hypothetical protein